MSEYASLSLTWSVYLKTVFLATWSIYNIFQKTNLKRSTSLHFSNMNALNWFMNCLRDMTGTLGLILREFKAGRYHQGGLYALTQTMPYRWSRTLPPGKSKVAIGILRNTGRANPLEAIGTLDLIRSQGRSLRPSVKYVDD